MIEQKDLIVTALGECQHPSSLNLKSASHPRASFFVSDSMRIRLDLTAGESAGIHPITLEVAGPRQRIFFEPDRTTAAIVTCGGLSPGLNNVIRSVFYELFESYGVRRGPLSSGKGVNLPDTELPMSALTEKDRQDARWIAERDFDYVALSFVQRAGDVDELRSLLQEYGSKAHIITKIEKPQAIDHIDAIIDRADAVMVARGDLGVEMDFPTVPVVQKTIAYKCQVAGKPCIIATEMLESMITSPRPTRAEVSDVANAVFDRADAVMLSAESSVGEHPVAAVDTMSRIVVAAEQFLNEYGDEETRSGEEFSTTALLVGSVRQVMLMNRISAIATFTSQGTTARTMSKSLPQVPILALSSQPTVARRARLYYGVVPRVIELPDGIEPLLDEIVGTAKDLQLATPGDRIAVLTGHPVGAAGGRRALIVEKVA